MSIHVDCEGSTELLFHWSGRWWVSTRESGVQLAKLRRQGAGAGSQHSNLAHIDDDRLDKAYCYVLCQSHGNSDTPAGEHVLSHVATRDMRTHRLIALDDHCIGTQQPQELTDSVFLDHLRAGGGACVTGDYGVTIRLPSLMERLETYVSTRIDQHRDLAPLIALSWLIKGLLNTHLTSDTDKLRCSVMLKQLTDKTLTNTEPTSGSPAAVTMPFGHASESISAHNTTQSSETVPIQVRNTHSREPCTQEALGRSYEALDEALRLTNQVLSHPDTRDVSANDMGRHRLLKKHSTLVRRLACKLASWRTPKKSPTHMFDPITCDCNFTPGFLCGVLVGANVPGTAPSQQSQADKAPAVFSGDTDSIADELETKLKLKDERESLTGDISGGTLSFSDGSYDKVSIESAAKLLAINRFDATQSYDAETIIVAQVRNVLAIKEPPPTKKLKCTENTYDENINVLRLSPAMFPLVDTCYSAAGVLLVRSSPQPNRCKPGLDRLEVLTLLEFRKKKSNIKQHLPGGKREVYEHMAVHTAAREMFEETGGHSVYVNRVDDEMPHAQLVRFIHNMLVQSIWINSARYVVYVCNLDSAVDEDLNLFNNIETAFGNIPEEERHPESKTQSVSWLPYRSVSHSKASTGFFQLVLGYHDVRYVLETIAKP